MVVDWMVVDYITEKEALLLMGVVVVMVSKKGGQKGVCGINGTAYLMKLLVIKLFFTIIIKIKIYYHHESYLLIVVL